MSLHLPENFELFAGTNFEDICLYYNLIKVCILGNIGSAKLVMNVPIKTGNQYFSLYEMVALPVRISQNRFVKYSFDYT